MPDGGFKGMSPDPDSERNPYGATVECPDCGTRYEHGAWPFCAGDPTRHERS